MVKMVTQVHFNYSTLQSIFAKPLLRLLKPSLSACICALLSACQVLSSSVASLPQCCCSSRPQDLKASQQAGRLELHLHHTQEPPQGGDGNSSFSLLCHPISPFPPSDSCYSDSTACQSSQHRVCFI